MKPQLRKFAKLLIEWTEPSTETKAIAARPRKALIVEDCEVDAEVLGHRIRAEGWEFEVASSPKFARIWLESTKFDIIFMDMSFAGDMDGYKFSEELARKKGTENIPIVFVTGFPDALVKKSGGTCVIYIGKPPSMEGMKRVLKIANGVNGHTPPLNPRPRVIISASVTLLLLSFTIGTGFSSGDGWLIKLLITLFKTLSA